MSEDTSFTASLAQAGAGDADAQFAVAQAYQFGTGVAEDADQARAWLQKAAEAGHRRGQAWLAQLLHATGDPASTSQAIAWYQRAADQGDPGAMFVLGDMYLRGSGVPLDRRRAASLLLRSGTADAYQLLTREFGEDGGHAAAAAGEWTREQAEQGDAEAQFHYAESRWREAGGQATAIAFFERAAAQGHGLARCRLAAILWAGREAPRDRARAIELYRAAADQGVGEARRALVRLHARGVAGGVPVAEALHWLLRQDGYDDTTALHNLALAYRDAAVSRPAAAHRLAQAAEQGNTWAQAMLGRLHLRGEGVALDPVAAERWLKLAAEDGVAEAILDLGRLYLHGAAGVPADPAAAARYLKSCGEYEAGAALAWLDSGVEAHVVTALELMRGMTAVYSTGHDMGAAAYRLGHCYRVGYGVEKELLEAARWFSLAQQYDTDLSYVVQCQLGDLYAHDLGGSPRAVMEFAFAVGAAFLRDEKMYSNTGRDHIVPWWTMAAEQGHPQAPLCLGRFLWHAPWASADGQPSGKWLRLAAEAGHAEAQFLLAAAHEEGRGVERSLDEAIRWLRLAAEQDYADAQNRLADLLRDDGAATGDLPTAVAWYRRAVRQGHAAARESLTELYLSGEHAAASAGEIVQWLKSRGLQAGRATLHKHFIPMLALASACMTGDDVTPDPAWATQVFVDAVLAERTAAQSLALGEAMYALGERYRDGTGVGRSAVAAIRWFVVAQRFGAVDAQRCRTQLDRLLGDRKGAAKVDLLRQVGAVDSGREPRDGEDHWFGPLESCCRLWAREEREAIEDK